MHTAPAEDLCPEESPVRGGEVMGSMLIGLIGAFRQIHAVSSKVAAHLADGIVSGAWYPMAYFFRLLDAVCRRDVDHQPILFQAGIAFVNDWYSNGAGRGRVSSAADFLRVQGTEGGFAGAHRGRPEDIGWHNLVEFDEAAGRATVVCINPYPREFERGVFHGGMLLAGDVQHVEVESAEQPYGAHLSKKTITLRFSRMPDAATRAQLDALLAGMSPGQPLAHSPALFDAMAWRLKAAEAQLRDERLFHRQSSLLLSRATDEIYEFSRNLDTLAHHDELTGLLNRRAVLKRAESLLALSVRQGWPIAFVMIDIDHFKRINDVFGHAAGDETLRHVGFVLKSRLRNSDLLGRIGGEEFLVVLPDADLDGAATVAESLRVEVEKQVPLFSDGQLRPVTISLGVAVVRNHKCGELDTFIRQADQALYRSKQTGRNRITFWPCPADGETPASRP